MADGSETVADGISPDPAASLSSRSSLPRRVCRRRAVMSSVACSWRPSAIISSSWHRPYMDRGVVKHAPCTAGGIRKCLEWDSPLFVHGWWSVLLLQICLPCARHVNDGSERACCHGSSQWRCYYGGQRHSRPNRHPRVICSRAGQAVHVFFRQIKRTICQWAHFGGRVTNWTSLGCPLSPLLAARARSIQRVSSSASRWDHYSSERTSRAVTGDGRRRPCPRLHLVSAVSASQSLSRVTADRLIRCSRITIRALFLHFSARPVASQTGLVTARVAHRC